MDALPTELKDNIACHVSQFSEESPRLARECLANLRLTCRSWSEPPLPYLLHHVHLILPGHDGELAQARLIAIAQTARLAKEVCHLTVLTVCDHRRQRHKHEDRAGRWPRISYYDQDGKHTAWKQVRAQTTPEPCTCEGVSFGAAVLAAIAYDLECGPDQIIHVLRGTLPRFPRLRSLSTHNLASYREAHPKEWEDRRQEDFRSGAISNPYITSAYILTRETSLTELCISSDDFQTYSYDSGKYYMTKSLRTTFFYRDTSRIRALALKKLCLNLSPRKYALNGDQRYIANVVCTITNLLTKVEELPNLEYLALLFAESVPSKLSIEPVIPLNSISRSRYPNLHTLSLHGFCTSQDDDFKSFITKSTPKLRNLRLGSIRLAPGTTWWGVMDHLRSSASLQQLLLTGPVMSDSFVTWRISEDRHDPRPITHGDSIQHEQIESYVTRRSDEDPRAHLNPSMRRLHVWNASKQRPALMAGIGA